MSVPPSDPAPSSNPLIRAVQSWYTYATTRPSNFATCAVWATVAGVLYLSCACVGGTVLITKDAIAIATTGTPTSSASTSSPIAKVTGLPSATAAATPSPIPTNTTLPTATPQPTETARPTSTPEPPTATPLPSVTPEPAVTERLWKIGESFEIDAFKITVHGIKTTKKISIYSPSEGNTFLLVSVSVENIDKNERFLAVSNFNVVDGDRHQYTPRAAGESTLLESGDIGSGNIAEGQIVYEVPIDATGLELQYTSSALFSDDQVVHVALQ